MWRVFFRHSLNVNLLHLFYHASITHSKVKSKHPNPHTLKSIRNRNSPPLPPSPHPQHILYVPGIMAFINKEIEPLIFFSSLTLSKLPKLIVHNKKIYGPSPFAGIHLSLPARIFHFVKARIHNIHGTQKTFHTGNP